MVLVAKFCISKIEECDLNCRQHTRPFYTSGSDLCWLGVGGGMQLRWDCNYTGLWLTWTPRRWGRGDEAVLLILETRLRPVGMSPTWTRSRISLSNSCQYDLWINNRLTLGSSTLWNFSVCLFWFWHVRVYVKMKIFGFWQRSFLHVHI